jgi:hypothetical protein
MLRKPVAIAAAGALAASPSAFVTGPVASGPFSWLDAGIGASVTAGCALALVGGRRVIVQRRLHQAS